MKHIIDIVILVVLFTTVSCIKDEQAYTTFTGDMVYSYLQKDTSYSEFVRVLDKAGLKGSLNSYCKFTCFAPTNKAMCEYYRSQGKEFTIDSFRPGQLDTLAKSHLLANVYHTYEFTNGVLPNYNMNYEYLEVHFDEQQGGILLNGSSRIISKDNDVYNGVVHGVNKVFKLMIACLPDLMAQDSTISIFNKALRLTHLSDSLKAVVDVNPNSPQAYYYYGYFLGAYNPQYKRFYSPHRRFGYTAFVENNAVLQANGVSNLQDLIERARQLYPAESRYDDDFTNRENSLNKYIAYHLIDKAIYNNRFFYTRNAIRGYTPDEFLETMLTNRIIRVSNVNTQTVFNAGSNYSVRVKEAYDKRTQNGAYYLLDRMLLYNVNVEQMLQNIRIRFDVASLFPELTNNNIRGNTSQMSVSYPDNPQFVLDRGYLTHMSTSPGTNILYISGREDQPHNYSNFQSDVLFVMGYYDFTIRLLPVPPGTYELRFGTVGVVSSSLQVYVDNVPMGIPENFSGGLSRKSFGYLLDSETDDDGVKYDQILRMKGFMKAPNTFWGRYHPSNYTLMPARDNAMVFRKIVGVFSFTDYKPHTIRFRSIENTVLPFHVDYFEFVPKSVYAPPGYGEYESRD